MLKIRVFLLVIPCLERLLDGASNKLLERLFFRLTRRSTLPMFRRNFAVAAGGSR